MSLRLKPGSKIDFECTENATIVKVTVKRFTGFTRIITTYSNGYKVIQRDYGNYVEIDIK